MRKRPMCKAVSIAAAAVLCCSPLCNFSGLSAAAAEQAADDALVSVIVTLDGDALLADEEGADQGADYLGTAEAASRADEIAAKQKAVQKKIRKLYPALDVKFSYDVLLNGFACQLPESVISQVSGLPGVKDVSKVTTYTVPKMDKASAMGGFPAYYDATGCTGEGQVVCVIDTELNTESPMFAPIDDKNVALTKADIAEIAENVGFNVEIDPERAYISSKLPYVIDYVDDPYEGAPDPDNYHGTHVSGIAAGNEITDYEGKKIAGIARDAQLVFMAVGTWGGGLDEDAIIAATEDAIKLHADVINMSFGKNGEAFESTPMDELYTAAANAGIVICLAAGNEDNGSTYGMDALAQQPDVGMMTFFSPGAKVMTVASADNTYVQHYRLLEAGDAQIPYAEMIVPEGDLGDKLYLGDALEGTEYPLTDIGDGVDAMFDALMAALGDDPGFIEGDDPEEPIDPEKLAAAYRALAEGNEPVLVDDPDGDENTDGDETDEPILIDDPDGDENTDGDETDDPVLVDNPDGDGEDDGEEYEEELPEQIYEGQIVMVDFGALEPSVIVDFAEQRGAVGVIFVDTDGYYATGSYSDLSLPHAFITNIYGQQIRESGAETVRFIDGEVDFQIPTGISPYSSWGTAQSLEIRPDIMGIGGYVESASYYGNAVMSGTSMATPYLTGCTAVLAQYLKENKPELEGAEKFEFIRSLMMNSAVPYADNDMLVSPRQQGAGFVSVNNAINDKVLLTGATGEAKINLYDKLGSTFSFDVTITNISDEDVSFKDAAIRLTTNDSEFDEEMDAYLIKGQQPLEADADASSLLTVKAGESRTETLTVTLNDEQLKQIGEIFTNGFFVEGFLLLSGAENCCDISVPMLGFCGDWAAIPIFAENSTFAFFTLGTSFMPAGAPFSQMVNTVLNVYRRLTDEDIEASDGDYLAAIMEAMTEEEFAELNTVSYPMGYVSPDNDGLGENLGVSSVVQRVCRMIGMNVLDSEGNLLIEGEPMDCPIRALGGIAGTDTDLSGLEDGIYYAAISAMVNYPASKENPQEFRIPFTVDRTYPSVSTRQFEEGGKKLLEITAEDANLDGLFILGTGNGGIAADDKTYDYDPENITTDGLAVLSMIDILLSGADGMWEGVPVVASESQPELAKYLLNSTQSADFMYCDFANLIPAEPDENGSFTVIYDVTNLSNYSVTAIDKAMNMTEQYVDVAAPAEIRQGVWKTNDHFAAFGEDTVTFADLMDGSIIKLNYTYADGELVTEGGKKAAVEEINPEKLRVIWEDGALEVYTFVQDGTLDELSFYTVNQILEIVNEMFAENYLIGDTELSRTESTVTANGDVIISFWVKDQEDEEEQFAGNYIINIFTGEGSDIYTNLVSMTDFTEPMADPFTEGIWQTGYNDGDFGKFFWFDQNGHGKYKRFDTGTYLGFTYEMIPRGVMITFENAPDAPVSAKLTVMDEQSIFIRWEDGSEEWLSYRCDKNFDNFHFYTIEEMKTMALNDYYLDNTAEPSDIFLFPMDGNKIFLSLIDETGENALQIYEIDPETGIAEKGLDDDSMETVSLPQTGNNDPALLAETAGAVLMLIFGAYVMTRSRKNKKDEMI